MDDVIRRAYNLSEFEEWLPKEPTPPNGSNGEAPFTVPPTIRDGTRNDTLYRTARMLHAKGLSAPAIRATLHAENTERGDPPLPAAEVDEIATHATTQANRPDFDADLIDADMITVDPPAVPSDEPFVERFPAFCLRLRDRILPPDLVPGLIPRIGLVMAHGQPRSLKTWIAEELARATSTGTMAFGLDRFAVQAPQETWYLTEEDPEVEIRNRFTCLFAGTQTSAPDTLHVSVQKAIAIDDPAWQRRMITYAKDAQIAFTIIDPVRASSDAVDQGPRELKPLAHFLRTFMRETGSALLLVHHDVKPLAGKPDDRAKPQRASGGGIFSIADAPIHAELVGPSQTMLTPSFYKFAVAPAPCLVTLTADDPKRPTWVRLVGENTTATAASDLVLLSKIRDYLREHPGTSGSKVATGIHASKEKTLAALERLFVAGEADSYQRGQARLWSIVATGAHT